MDKLGVGIVGTGWVSGEYIRAFGANTHTEVRAIVSRDKARAQAKAAEYGVANCRSFDRLEDMLADANIHIAAICTPHHLHVPQGIAAAKAGKHIVIEKPVALDLAGMRELQKAVRDARVRTIVSFVLRWNPLFETIRALLGDGVIGKLFYGEVDYFHGIGPWYGQYEWKPADRRVPRHGRPAVVRGQAGRGGLRLRQHQSSKPSPLRIRTQQRHAHQVRGRDDGQGGFLGRVRDALRL
jgi:predicted dehydrogenase